MREGGARSMSEQQNIQAIQAIYAAFNRVDIGYILDQLSDDVKWETHFDPVVPWGGDFSGRGNVSRFFEAIARSVDVNSFEPMEFIAQGNKVVSLGTFGCTVRAT